MSDPVSASRIVAVHDADEDARLSNVGRRRVRPPGILQGVPRCLKNETQLRIEIDCFPRRDAEEGRVKYIGFVDQSRPVGTGIRQLAEETAASSRHFAHGAPARLEQVPELFQRVGSGTLDRHPHDGHASVLPCRAMALFLAGRSGSPV